MNWLCILVFLHNVLKITRTAFKHILTPGNDERFIFISNNNKTTNKKKFYEIYSSFQKYKLLLLLESSEIGVHDKLYLISNSKLYDCFDEYNTISGSNLTKGLGFDWD